MTDTIDNTLAATIRSLRSVVVPAVDTSHPLAVEQAGLILETLQMLRAQLPERRARALRELERYASMADQVLSAAEWPSNLEERLDEQLRAARSVSTSVSADINEIGDAAAALASTVCDSVRTARAFDNQTRTRIDHIVLKASQPVLDDELSWFAHQGWSDS